MPRNASGVYTLPAGNPVVGGTIITSTWANATLPDIGTELTSSLDRSGRGGMLAAFRATDGVIGVPGISFSNETTSGFWRASAGVVNASILGVKRFQLDVNGLWGFSDAYGVTAQLATTAGYAGFRAFDQAAARKIELVYVGSAAATVYGITAGNAGINAQGSSFTFSTADTARMIVMATGPVVVGAASNAAIGAGVDPFAVNGNIGLLTQLNLNDAAFGQIINRAAGGLKFYVASGSIVGLAIGVGGGCTILADFAYNDGTAAWFMGRSSSFNSGGGASAFGLRSQGSAFEFGFSGGAPVFSIKSNSDVVAIGVAAVRSKSASTTRISTVALADDPDLIVPLLVGRYDFEALLLIAAAATGAMGFKTGMAFTGTNTANDSQFWTSDAALGFNTLKAFGFTETAAAISTGATPINYVLCKGSIVVTVAGNLSVQWAQNSSTAQNLVVFPGSYLRCVKSA